MSETRENCTKTVYDECRLHPVDCPNCVHGDTCKARSWMQANPSALKSCRHFRKK